ncbi:hypothetical protein BGZ92_006240, partial [Podila epicladia]
MKRLSLILAVATHAAYAGAGISLTDDHGMWYGKIGVGTPSKTFKVVFDTGTADLFLPGSSCDSACTGHTLYDPRSADGGKTFLITNGGEPMASGEQFDDAVSIGGFTATNQALGAATQYSSSLAADQFAADGILGMAFPQISAF